VQADYTNDIHAIATALSRSAPLWSNPWILATFSTLLGFIGGFVGQLLVRRYDERKTRETILRLCYRYSGELLAALDTLVSAPEDLVQHTGPALRIVLPTPPQDYVKAHIEIYAALSEAVGFDVIFNAARNLEEPSGGYDWLNAVLQTLVMQFVKKRLTLKSVRRYGSKEEADTFGELLSRYEQRIKELY
jgi:hypothetical protein